MSKAKESYTMGVDVGRKLEQQATKRWIKGLRSVFNLEEQYDVWVAKREGGTHGKRQKAGRE